MTSEEHFAEIRRQRDEWQKQCIALRRELSESKGEAIRLREELTNVKKMHDAVTREMQNTKHNWSETFNENKKFYEALKTVKKRLAGLEKALKDIE